ncbi:MAG: retroviral-like aspartic protease [Scytonema sp. PMC 1069.18]|nr:retroviral-like aspartic protease [Scytonema sp. PMC 1069.18]MEC4881514.1 retroviral-like aspartic protease [Scytonema sp. PMC 1070.18]
MSKGQRFSYTKKQNNLGLTLHVPFLDLVLNHGDRFLQVTALLDTGADVNVLPYNIGQELGAVWEEQATPLQLGGNLAKFPARGLILLAIVGEFPPVPLVFAWSQSNNVPLLLGHVNFFAEFDVCFYTSQLSFEISLKQ